MFEDLRQVCILRSAAFIAKYSYGIYLVHTPLMWLVFIRLRSGFPVIQIGVFLLLVAGCSILLYHFVEQPIIRLGATLSKPRVRFGVQRHAGEHIRADEPMAHTVMAFE